MLEAKAKDQGHSRKCSPKKNKKNGLQKSFSGNLQFKGVTTIFDWGEGGKPQITRKDVIKIFKRESFCGTKIS